MPNIEIYTKDWCPYCARAKADLERKGLTYREFDVTRDVDLESEMIARSGRRTVPQIFVDGAHLGGSDDLRTAEKNGLLDRLLAGVRAAVG